MQREDLKIKAVADQSARQPVDENGGGRKIQPAIKVSRRAILAL